MIGIAFLASCTKTNKQGRLIPTEASVVFIMNGQSLTDKLPWNEVKQNAAFIKMNGDTSVPAFIKKIADNPDNAGIDIKNNVSIFMVNDSSGMYVGIEGIVKDADKFRLFNLDLTKNGFEADKGSFKTITSYPLIVGYNKDRFVYIIDKHTSAGAPIITDSTMPAVPKVNTTSSRDLAGTCESVFNLSEKNSLGENERFTTLVKKKGDIYCWVNIEQMQKANFKGTMGAGSLFNMDKLYEGNVTAGTINFDNGRINVDMVSYASKEMTAIWKKYEGSAFNTDMVKSLPSKQVAAIFAMNFKPEAIRQMVNTMNMEGIINLGLSFAGITMDDFIKANKGDFLFAATDIKSVADTTSKGNIVPAHRARMSVKPDILFVTSIGDKDAMNNLIKAGKKMAGNNMGDSTQSPVSYNSNGKYVAISNSKEKADQYLAGGNNSFEFLDKMSGKPFGGFIDFQYVMKSMAPNVAGDSSKQAAYDASVKMWDNLYYKGGNFTDGGIAHTIEVNLVDKNTNSLKQLNQYAAIMALLHHDRKDKNEVKQATRTDNRMDTMVSVKPIGHIGHKK